MDAATGRLEYQAAQYGGNADYTMSHDEDSVSVTVPVTAA